MQKSISRTLSTKPQHYSKPCATETFASRIIGQVSGAAQRFYKQLRLAKLDAENKQAQALVEKLEHSLGQEPERLQVAHTLFKQGLFYESYGLSEQREALTALAFKLIRNQTGSQELLEEINSYFFLKAQFYLEEVPLKEASLKKALSLLLKILESSSVTPELEQKVLAFIKSCTDHYCADLSSLSEDNLKKGIALKVLIQCSPKERRNNAIGFFVDLPWERFFKDMCIIDELFYKRFTQIFNKHQATVK